MLSQHFLELSKEVGLDHVAVDLDLMSGGIAFFDYNNDGFDDLYCTGGEQADKLYENNGDGTFSDITEKVGLNVLAEVKTMGVVTGDINNDGFQEILITTTSLFRSYLFLNNSGQFFTEIGEEAGLTDQFFGSSAAMGDYDLDGDLDIYIGEYVTGFIENGFWVSVIEPQQYFYRNNGNNTFTNVASELGVSGSGTALAVSFSDVDFDGDPDLLVGNDFGFVYKPNELFINNYPVASFTEISEQANWDLAINSMGLACGDYDEDGDLDYYVTNIGSNHLLTQEGRLEFIESAAIVGVEDSQTTSWGTAFFDYNNDTWLDLFVSNGPIVRNKDQLHQNRLFEGGATGMFTEVSEFQNLNNTQIARGMAVSDYNNDGRLDLAVANVIQPEQTEMSGHTLLYRNENATNNWIKVKLQGEQSNHDGYGALVKVVIGNRSWIREIQGGSSYLSNHTSLAHFGLNAFTRVDSLIVYWPGKRKEVFIDLPVNKTFLIWEGKELFFRHAEVKTVCPGDLVEVNGRFLSKAGVYTDTLNTRSSSFREIKITHVKLQVDHPDCLPIDEESSCYTVFPNPFKRQIIIQRRCQTEQEIKITLVNFLGREVYHSNISGMGQSEDINLQIYDTVPTGFYIIRIQQGTVVEWKKIIKL